MGLVTNRVYLRNVSVVISTIIKQNKSKDKINIINTNEETGTKLEIDKIHK